MYRTHPGATFKVRELIDELELSKSQKEKVQEVVADMCLRGILEKQKKRYGLKSAELMGTLSVNKAGEGFVTVEGYDSDFFIAPSRLKTALNGDKVLIIAFRRTGRARRHEAEVVAVVERHNTRIVGTFESNTEFAFVVPDNRKIPRDIYVAKDSTGGAKHGQKVVVQLDKWEDEHLNPQGSIIEVIGFPGEKGVDVLSVVKGHDLHFEFPRKVEEECRAISDTIPASEIARRLDLRNHLVFTIDPFDARDFDDAVSLETTPEGHWILGVHIADVSYYVREGTWLDKEAYKRGTSTYLVDRVIPMLPEKLSNEVCSLRPHEDSLTFSVLMKLDKNGRLLDYDIVESVIHSKRRFTYEEVQVILGEEAHLHDGSDVAQTLFEMHRLSRTLTAKRLREGSIDFDTPETKFRLNDDGVPVECYRKDRLDSHRLVEEFMLMANQVTARHIADASDEGQNKHASKKWPFMYRIHDKPPSEKLENFLRLLKVFGYSLAAHGRAGHVTPAQFQQVISKVKGKKEQGLIEKVAIRTMAKAEYSPNNIGHFGLAFAHYAHFTSPIRRYPDLIVHRLLKEYAQGMTVQRLEAWSTKLDEMARHCSGREKTATEAERDSIKVKQVEFMLDKVGMEYPGIVSGVMGFGIFVEIPDYLIEGLVHIRDLDDDYYTYDEKNYRLVGKRHRKVYQLGDQVTIRVVAVSREKGEIDFLIVR